MKGWYWRIINHSELNFCQTLRWISHQKQTWIFFNFRKWSRFKIQKSFSWQVGIVAMQCKVLQSMAMYCIVTTYCRLQKSNVLQHIAKYFNVLQWIAMFCIVTMQCKILQSIARNVLQNIAKYCNVLQSIASIAKYCKVLQSIAMNCIVATYCTALHCNTIAGEQRMRG